MRKKFLTIALTVAAVSVMSLGYGAYSVGAVTVLKKSGETTEETSEDEEETEILTADDLEEGTYSAEFVTDSSMFKVNEANDGKGVLTVKDGKMTIHVSLVSQSIVNLFVGTAEDAQKDGAELLEPTLDTVTYEDGTTDEVNGFDIPVETIGEDFDLALVGTKGKWYDHKVSVKNPEKISDDTEAADTTEAAEETTEAAE